MADRDKGRERVQRAVGQARRAAEQGAKDITEAVTRGLQDASRRARRSAKGNDSSTGEPGSPSVEEVAADPAAYFSAEQQKANERLGHANILVSGQTGVGKSTLINAVFRVPLAEEGTGKPVTKNVQRYDVAGVPVTIYDTPGIELGHAKKDVIRDYVKTIADSRRSGPQTVIHVAWYCIDAGQTRVQGYDVEIVGALAAEVPVILVLTQCIDEDRASALARAIAAENMPIEGSPIRTLARERRVAGHTIPPQGLEELVERTNEILPEAVRGRLQTPKG